jgi:hypothetical protein
VKLEQHQLNPKRKRGTTSPTCNSVLLIRIAHDSNRSPSLTRRVRIGTGVGQSRAGIIAVEKEADGLLDQMLHGGVT